MPEPGWYEDPSDAHHVRWWDGGAWTARTAPAPGARPEAGDDRPRRWTARAVLAIAAVAAVAGLGAFLGARALLDDDTSTSDRGGGDGGSDAAAEPTSSTVPAADLVVGPAEPAVVAVLGSIAQAGVDPEAAAERARALAGLNARVLDSDEFVVEERPEPLEPGLWVLWSGPFPDPAAAQAFCEAEVAAAGVEGCYPLRIAPSP